MINGGDLTEATCFISFHERIKYSRDLTNGIKTKKAQK